MTQENKTMSVGRLLPDSGKLHQNQEVWHVGGYLLQSKLQTIKSRL